MRRLKWLGGLALMLMMMANTQAAARGAAQAMVHWYTSVAPVLLPFLALMPLLTSREAAAMYERALGGIMKALFRLPGASASALLVGMVAGAPAGAMASRNVAVRSGMSQSQLNRLAAAACGFSPAFLVGGIGSGLLGSTSLGWRLLEAQVLTQLTLAVVLKWAWRDRDTPLPETRELPEDKPMRGAVAALLSICGYMMLFGALAEVAGEHIGPGPSNILLCLLDVPSGARLVAGSSLAEESRLMVLSGMCGFGGFCVVAQCLGALKGCGVKPIEFASVRVMAGIISASYMGLLTRAADGGAVRMALAVRGRPLELAALIAVLLSVPAMVCVKKQYLNTVNSNGIR